MTESSADQISAKSKSRSPDEIVLSIDVEIPMRDGIILRGDVARPAQGKWPMIIMQSPYGKSSASTQMIRNLTEFARKGFVAAYIDTRGRFASEGNDEFAPFVGHGPDGADVVQWAAEQPWSNGDVFGYGPSYHGFTQWATAGERPQALKAISPGIAPGEATRSLLYWDGLLELGLISSWWMMMGANVVMRRHASDPAALEGSLQAYGAAFNDMLTNGFSDVPPAAPFERAGWGDGLIQIIESERGHGQPTLDALSAAQQFEKVAVPALIWGGWYDIFSAGSIAQFVGMRTHGGSVAARENSRLVMGPWAHTIEAGNIVGERDFGPSAAAIALQPDGLENMTLSYFQSVAAGVESELPRVKIFVMGANRWRDEEDWPIARTQMTPLYLASDGHANGRSGDGRLTAEHRPSPGDSYVYDPTAPVPTHGGNILWTGLAGPRDQRIVEERADILVYTSEPLAEGVEVTGTVAIELWIETDVVDTDFCVKLVDVAPDGTAYPVAEGGRRARWRDDPEMRTEGSPLSPGTPTLIHIELNPTSNLFLPGHSIRLDVTSSNFPRWRRNLNIWDQRDARLEDCKVAHHKVLHDEDHRSRILLPVIPSAGNA